MNRNRAFEWPSPRVRKLDFLLFRVVSRQGTDVRAAADPTRSRVCVCQATGALGKVLDLAAPSIPPDPRRVPLLPHPPPPPALVLVSPDP